MYFEIFRQPSGAEGDLSGGAWRWRLKASDQEIVTSAESYADHADCLRAVYLIRSTSNHTPIRDV